MTTTRVESNGHCLTAKGSHSHNNTPAAKPMHHRFIQRPPLLAKKSIRRLLAFSVVVMVFNLWRFQRMMMNNETYSSYDGGETTSSFYMLYSGSLSYLLGAGPEVPILTTNNNNYNNKTLVIYSGPLTFANDQDHQSVLKWANFMYFLEKAIVCDHYHDDVVVVVGFQLQAYTEEKLAPLVHKCQQYPSPRNGKQITVVARANRCFQMESVRLAMQHTHNRPYQYFVVLTDSVTGPWLPPPPPPLVSAHRHVLSPELLPPWQTTTTTTTTNQDDNTTTTTTTLSSLSSPTSWTTFLTSRLTDEIKMVGLSVSCRGADRWVDPHVDTSLYALDRVGMRIVLKTNCVYDCRRDEAGDGPQAVYTRYDLGMSRTLLRAGYGITSILQPNYQNNHHHHNSTTAPAASTSAAVSVYFSNNTRECRHSNVWHRHEMYRYFQRIPSFEELRFFQTTRFVPDEIADAIGYTGRPRVFSEEQSSWDNEILQMALGGRTNLLAAASPSSSTSKPLVPKETQPQQQERSSSSSLPYRVVVFLVQPICTSLEWMDSYFRNIRVESYTIINNCGNRADGAPTGSRIIPATNFSTEQVFATLLLQVAQDYAQAQNNKDNDMDDDGDDVLVFWHGGANLKNGWNGTDIVHRAHVTGFACKTKPFCAPRCRNKFQPTAMHLRDYWNAFSHTPQDEETSSRTTTTTTTSSKTDDDLEDDEDDDESMGGATTTIQRLGDWLQELGGVNEHRLVPVCHGNGFAMRRRQVALQSLGFWKALQHKLATSRSRRKTDFVFAERSWAALLTEPLPIEAVRAMHNRTATILGKKSGYAVRHQRREMKGMLLFDLPPRSS